MSCVSTATATQFQTITSTSVSTSFSDSVTTLPDTTSTDIITSCLSSADITLSGSSGVGVGTCVSSTVITSTTVIDGGVSTTQVPFEITNRFTTTVATNTQFAPCEDTTAPPETTPTTTTTTTSPTLTTEFSQSSTTLVVTPTTTFTSSQDTTLSDGQTSQIIVTVTSLLPPTTSVSSSSVPVATTQANDNEGGSSSSALGPIVGGTLGGFAGLLLIVGAVWFFRRRRANWDDIFEKDYEEYSGSKPLAPTRSRMLDLEDEPFPIHPAEANTEPKPYVYGLVGSKTANPPSLDAGLTPARNASQPSLSSHGRTPSTTPLMNNAAASRPGSSGDSNHVSGGTNGVSPSPSLTPSAAGGRSGSPGPLGVQIPTGPMFAESGGESPTSVMGSRGPLFIANQLDPITPPGSPRPASPATPPAVPTHKKTSTNLSNVVSAPSPSPFSGAVPMATFATPSATGPPPAAYAYLAEKQRQQLERNDTVSSASVYSQPSRAPTPPPARALGMASSQPTASGVVVHTDAGRIKGPTDQPPAYQG